MPETIITSIDIDIIDVDEPLQLALSTTGTSRELWVRWQSLCELAEKVGAQMTEAGQRWKDTTEPMTREHLWVEYEAQTRQFRVLMSWKDVFYAAYIFSTDGADCAALDDSSPLS